MKTYAVNILIVALSCLIGASYAFGQELRYDAQKNGVVLYGPYLKYNFLSPPFSFGLSEFKKSDLNLEVIKKDSKAYLLSLIHI